MADSQSKLTFSKGYFIKTIEISDLVLIFLLRVGYAYSFYNSKLNVRFGRTGDLGNWSTTSRDHQQKLLDFWIVISG